MANKTASLKVTLTYAAPGGGNASVSLDPLSVPYAAMSADTIDVPDAEAASTDHTISFGSVGTGATLLLVLNKTGQPLTLTVNGGDLVSSIADGKYALLSPGDLGGSPITSAKVTTTDIQAGAGSVDTFVFGDPV